MKMEDIVYLFSLCLFFQRILFLFKGLKLWSDFVLWLSHRIKYEFSDQENGIIYHHTNLNQEISLLLKQGINIKNCHMKEWVMKNIYLKKSLLAPKCQQIWQGKQQQNRKIQFPINLYPVMYYYWMELVLLINLFWQVKPFHK